MHALLAGIAAHMYDFVAVQLDFRIMDASVLAAGVPNITSRNRFLT
jgi:hypothetical protein